MTTRTAPMRRAVTVPESDEGCPGRRDHRIGARGERPHPTIFLTSGKWSPSGASYWYQERMNLLISSNHPIPDHFVDVNKMVVPAIFRPGVPDSVNCLSTAETNSRR
jgi:hypothetical protein